jgi:hypothetical protein
MCLRRAPEKYIAGAALDRAGVEGEMSTPRDVQAGVPQVSVMSL